MRHFVRAVAFILAAPLAIAGASVAANAQTKTAPIFPNHQAVPLFGSIVGAAGEFAETRRIEVEAGGAHFNGVREVDCAGAIDYGQPDVTIDYRPGDASVERLNIMVLAEADTTMLVRLPDGTWLCDDDSGGNTTALISVATPGLGLYAIWAGLFEGGTSAAIVTVTEDGFPSETGLLKPDAQAVAQNGVLDLGAGLPDGPVELDVRAGGDNELPNFFTGDSICDGLFNTQQPTLHIENIPPGQRFVVDLASIEDTTLAIVSPGGTWLCNDDQFGSDPQVTVDNPEPGRYAVWAGTFDDIGSVAARLTVSESGAAGGEPPDGDLAPQIDNVLLSELILGTPLTREIVAGGDDVVADLGDDCTGFIDGGQPTAHIENATAGEAFQIRVTASADTTLVVLTPDNEWLCNDDFSDANPAVFFADPVTGRYSVWVGTFDRRDAESPAILTFDRAAG